MMLGQVLDSINNYFCVSKSKGTFTIEDGTMSLDTVQRGQFFRIVGSVFNDGVYQYPATELIGETFRGEVWALAVPKDVFDISEEISEYVKKNPEKPYVSESFKGYSYTNATGASGSSASWRQVFASRLNQWRKL